MKNRVLLVFLAIALVVSLAAFAACAKEEEAPPVEEEEVWQWPERLLLSSTGTVQPTYGAQLAWATPMSKDTGMTVRLICEADLRAEQMYVRDGRTFLTAPFQYRSVLYAQAGHARRDWGPWQSRIFYPAGRSCSSAIVRGDSGMKTPCDIKPGMKVGLITIIEEAQQSMSGYVAWAGLDMDDITWVPCNSTVTLGRWLMDGKVDVTVGHITQSFWFEVEVSPHGLAWLELDPEKEPEGAQRSAEFYPWRTYGIASGGCPSSEGVMMGCSIACYITRVESDSELVYRVIKWLDENYDRYKDGHPWCKGMTMDNLMDVAETHYEPLHDGTVRYLEEKGLWTEEVEARRQYNIELMTLWVESYQTAIDMADDKGMVVDPDNEEWVEFWENYREQQKLPLLVFDQGPGKEQPSYAEFYGRWNRLRPKY